MASTRISNYPDVNYGEMILTPSQQQNITFGELKKHLMNGTNIDCKHCGAPTKYNEKCEYCG